MPVASSVQVFQTRPSFQCIIGFRTSNHINVKTDVSATSWGNYEGMKINVGSIDQINKISSAKRKKLWPSFSINWPIQTISTKNWLLIGFPTLGLIITIYNKILKSDWLSTVLISVLIGKCYYRTVCIMPM